MRIRRIAPGEDPRAWAEAIAAFDPRQARLIKQDAGTTVWRAQLNSRDVAVKCWDLHGLARFKALVGAWRGDRHRRGAEWLLRHNLATARPLALLMEGLRRQWLVLEWLDGKTVLQHLADRDLSVSEEHLVARDLGAIADSLHVRGRFNRDPKPSNHIVLRGWHGQAALGLPVPSPTPPSGRLRVAVIDCGAIRKGRPDGLVRMLASMVIEPIGCGWPPRRALMMRAVRICRSGPPHRLWRQASAIVQSHGDPRPRVNPLTPPDSSDPPDRQTSHA